MLDFTLTLTHANDRKSYRVSLWRGGEKWAEAAAPTIDRARWQTDYLEPLQVYVVKRFPYELLVELGTALADLLLPPTLWRELTAELQRNPTAPVRLRLVIEPYELADLSWEFAYLKDAGFLCLQERFHVIRQTRPPGFVEPVAADPLRVLMAWADPQSPQYGTLPGLAEEVQNVKEVLAECRGVVVEELDQATPGRLRERLQNQPPHVLHFLGHAEATATGGFLALHGAQSGTDATLRGDELARWLAQTPVRLVVLSACSTDSPARGVAKTLAEKGVPAVVAMQLPLRDAAAKRFAHDFYRRLIKSPALIEEAVSEGRQAIRGMGPDWGVPVLYLSGESGELFRLPAARPPTNLPYPHNSDFVGRSKEMAELERLLHLPERLPVALVGMGGFGKTQLAVEYAHAHAMDYPGGVFWVNATDLEQLERDYAELGAWLEIPDLSTHKRMMRVRTRLYQQTQPSLLIFDNVTDAKVHTYLPPGGACDVLITTRLHYLARHGFRTLDVDRLDEEAALSLLQSRRRAESVEEQTAARQMAKMVGNLPLALALIAHHVERRDLTFAACRDNLASTPNRLKVLEEARRTFTNATNHEGSIYDVIDLTYNSLPNVTEAWRVLATAAFCFAEQSIAPNLLREACEPIEREAFEEAVAELKEVRLVTSNDERRLALHALVRVYAQEKMPVTDRCGAVECATQVLTRQLQQANEAMDWSNVRREIEHCRAAVELCQKENVAPLSLYGLLRELGVYFFEHGNFAAAAASFGRGLRISETAFGRRNLNVAECLKGIGLAREKMRDPDSALTHMREALDIAEELLDSNDPILAGYFNDIGYVLKMRGDLDGALPYYHKALDAYKNAYGDEHAKIAMCLNNVGTLLERKGDWDGALLHLRQAIAIDRLIFGERNVKVAIRLNNIGRVLGQQRRWEDALTHHRQALEIYQENYPDSLNPDIADSLTYVGNALYALGRAEEAGTHYADALSIYERVFYPEHEDCQKVREKLRHLTEAANRDAEA